MNNIIKALLVLLAVGCAAAQADTIVIRHATVHTMSGVGVLKDTDILIQGNTITRMSPALDAPKDAKEIDAGGKPVTPGFFAGISGIGIAEVSGVPESVDTADAMQEFRPEFDVSVAFNPNSSVLPVTRIEGFTYTMLGANMGGSIIAGQGRIAALDGGYDSLFGDDILFVNLGRSASTLSGGSRAAQWMLLDQAMDEAAERPEGAEATILTRNGRKALEQYEGGGIVVFSVDRASDILRTIAFAQKHNMQAIINGGAEAWMVAAQLAKSGFGVVLNPLQDLPGDFDELGSRLDNAALLSAAGVPIAIGGGETPNARKQRQLAGNAVSYGLDHEAGIAALTINPAKMFGVDKQFGSLEAGKRADLVLWSGDPLEVTSMAEQVIVNGHVDPMISRQTKLRDRYLKENPSMPRAYLKP